MPLPNIMRDDLTRCLADVLDPNGDLEDYRDLRRALTVLPPHDVKAAVLKAVENKQRAIRAEFQ